MATRGSTPAKKTAKAKRATLKQLITRTETVADNARSFDRELIEQLEDASGVAERIDRSREWPIAPPVAQQVEVVHPVGGDEVRRNPMPDKRREGRAVHEHQRRSIAAHGVANVMPIEAIALSQRPVSHLRVLLADARAKHRHKKTTGLGGFFDRMAHSPR